MRERERERESTYYNFMEQNVIFILIIIIIIIVLFTILLYAIIFKKNAHLKNVKTRTSALSLIYSSDFFLLLSCYWN